VELDLKVDMVVLVIVEDQVAKAEKEQMAIKEKMAHQELQVYRE
jgi:hypothetical protein